MKDLKGQFLAIRNPYNNEIIVRKCVGIPKQWIGRKDDGRYIEVPEEFVWVECSNNKNRQDDSLT